METAILEMAYDLTPFSEVSPRERPDFAIRRSPANTPFGVEVTQIFPSEAHARLNLVPGYMHRLWSGGGHLHKHDINVLQSVTVEIHDKEGNLKQSGVPAVLTQSPSMQGFRTALAQALRDKAAKEYDVDGLAHVDLVIFDWFELPFDPKGALTDRFFDEHVRQALQESPFREVFLILADRWEAEGTAAAESRPARWKIPLQQRLLMERAFATGRTIDETYRDYLRDVAHLNALMVDHVSRIQGYGEPVLCEGRLFLRYRGTLLEINATGMHVRDFQDFPLSAHTSVVLTERMDTESEARVTEFAAPLVFGLEHAEPANPPSAWVE